MGDRAERGTTQEPAEETANSGSIYVAKVHTSDTSIYQSAGRSIPGLVVEFVSPKGDQVRLSGFKDDEVLMVVTHDTVRDFDPFLKKAEELLAPREKPTR